MAGPVDWNRAERVAIQVAARQPGGGHTDLRGVDFTEMARLAEDRVEATTGLRSLLGPAEVRIVDRPDWIRANIASMRTLIDPVLNRLGVSGPLGAVTAQVAGVEVGVMLGW